MSDLPVQHYLYVYQARLSMAERGVTSPPPQIVTAMRQLVTTLSAQDPTAKVRLEIDGGQVRFLAAATGDLLGELRLQNHA